MISSLVVGCSGRSEFIVSVSSDSQSSSLLSSGGKSSKLAMLVNRLGNPVDFGVVSDGGVVGVDTDHFIVFVCSVLSNPV